MNRTTHNVSPRLWLFAILLLMPAACRTGAGGSSVKDIATDSTGAGTAGGAYLYFREDQSISRTICPSGILAVNYDRAHCTVAKQSVAAKPFIDALSVGVGDTIDQHARNVQDYYAGIKKASNELVQILAAAPAVQAQIQVLNQQLTVNDTKIASQQVTLDGFDQQISAVKARLAAQNSVDLNLQLGNLLDERNALLTQQNQTKSAEQAVRDAFISANSSSLDQDTLNDVLAQQATFVQQLKAEQALLTAAMAEVADLNKTVAHISDATFTFDVMEGTTAFAGLKPFTRRFAALFDQIFAAAAQAAAEQAAAAQAAAAQAAAAQAAAAQAAAAQAAADQAAAAQAAANLSAAQAAAQTAALQAAQDAATQAATAPSFSPTSFLLGTTPAVTFATALPTWAVNIAVVVDGRETIVAAGAQITLNLANAAVGAHKVSLVLVNVRGQRSQPSPVQAIDLHLTPGWSDVTPGGSCVGNWSNCAYKNSNTGLYVTKKFAQTSWFAASNTCDSLSANGFAGGWYLPRAPELQQLPRDITQVLSGSDFEAGRMDQRSVWSASANSGDPNASPMDQGLRDSLIVDFSGTNSTTSVSIEVDPGNDWNVGFVCFHTGT